MKKLVFVSNVLISAEPFTTADIIADYANISHKSVNRLISEHEDDLNSFGNLRFKIAKLKSGKGRPNKIYFLNEQQATLLITYLNNTEPVREFKKALVRQFFSMRQELDRRKMYKDLEKPVRRSLTDAIKEWPHNNKWSYKLFTDLICKAVTGMNTKQLKQSRKVNKNATSTEIYTSDELAKYQQIETKVITLIDLGMTYEDIKAIINNQTVTIKLVKKDVKKDLLSSPK